MKSIWQYDLDDFRTLNLMWYFWVGYAKSHIHLSHSWFHVKMVLGGTKVEPRGKRWFVVSLIYWGTTTPCQEPGTRTTLIKKTVFDIIRE